MFLVSEGQIAIATWITVFLLGISGLVITDFGDRIKC